MALDGVFLRHLKEEIGTSLLGTRVDRVFQPNRDELILAFRGFSAAYKLLISARANSARINLTTIPVENPAAAADAVHAFAQEIVRCKAFGDHAARLGACAHAEI